MPGWVEKELRPQDEADETSSTLKQIGFSRIVRCTLIVCHLLLTLIRLRSFSNFPFFGRVYVCFDERFQGPDIVKKSATEKKEKSKAKKLKSMIIDY